MPNTWKKLGLSFLVKSDHLSVFESCIIGLIAGFSALILESGVSALGGLRVYLSYVAPAKIALPLFGLIGGLIVGIIVEKISPEITGSGIPQVKAALLRAKTTLDLKVAITKLLAGTIALGSGFFMGREGPTVHVSAALAGQLNKWIPTTPLRRRQLIAAGAGAGLAAAFNAPIAGVLFVIEELLKDISAPSIGMALLASFVASVVSHLLCQHADLASIAAKIDTSIHLIDIPFYIVLGVLAGIAGAIFNRGVIAFCQFNQKVLRIPLMFKIALAGLISGIIIAFLPSTFRDYAMLREMVIVGDTNLITIPIAFIAFFFMTLIAYGSGAPGGLFAPSLALGSCLGAFIGLIEKHYIAGASPELFALVGMGAFFAAVARVPITAIVIIFEMTMNFSLVLPLMVVCLTATQVAERIYKGSIYDRLLYFIGIDPEKLKTNNYKSTELTAKDIMHKDVECLEANQTISQVKEMFSKSHHRGFPILSNNKIIGIISRLDVYEGLKEDMDVNQPITTIMSHNPIVVESSTPLDDILFLLDRYSLSRLPVVSESKILGIITRSDVIDALYKQMSN